VDSAIASLVVVLVVSAIAPLISDLLPGRVRIPQVVILLIGGILVGPQLLDWSTPSDIELFSTAGMAFLFLLAGYELELGVFRQRPGRLAIGTWVTSLVIGLAGTLGLYAVGIIQAPFVIALALSTTALGTLLPVLRENRLLAGAVGGSVLAVGAVGELGPILLMPFLPGPRTSVWGIVLVAVFLAIVLLAAFIPWGRAPGRLRRIIEVREHSTGQLTLRLVIAALFAFLLISEDFGFESALGAFAAGMVLRRWSPPGQSTLASKLDAVAFGLFIPIFFVYSGMTLDVDSIVANPVPMLIFLGFLLVVRGGPVLWWFRRDLTGRERVSVALFGSTTLPLLVALTTLAVQADHLSGAGQASIIGAGVVSVLVFPIVAVELLRGGRGRRADAVLPSRMSASGAEGAGAHSGEAAGVGAGAAGEPPGGLDSGNVTDAPSGDQPPSVSPRSTK
jgi:Kef-type K+ transport system membrane component KefB